MALLLARRHDPRTSVRPVRGNRHLPARVAVDVLARAAVPTRAYSFRLSVSVKVDDETKTETGVIRVVHEMPPRWIGQVRTLKTTVEGDAVFIDLGRHGHVIAILGKETSGQIVGLGEIVSDAFGIRIPAEDGTLPRTLFRRSDRRRKCRRRPCPHSLPSPICKTQRPHEIVNPRDFPTAFGDRVKLESVRIEITDEPVSRGIERKLPWLKENKTGYLHGKPICTAADLPCLDGGRFTQ